MANFLTDLNGQLSSVWKKLNTGQKVLLGFVTAAMVSGVIGVVYWTSMLEMGLLFGGLTPEDAGAIQSKLSDEGIAHELKDGGTAIYVPKDRRYELRNRFLQDGLVSGDGPGMELFDKAQIGMTEFLQEVNLTRGIEGELARTISWLEPVAAAKVRVTRPKQTIFTELQRKPTASVVVKLVPGRTLSSRQVSGISQIVSFSVEGLSPENVLITDSSGKPLSRPSTGDDDQMAADQLTLKQGYEKNLTEKVQKQLDAVVGKNKVSVMLNVDFDFKRETTKSKEYTYPAEGKVMKEDKSKTEETTKTMPLGGGATGTGAKIGGQQGGRETMETESMTSEDTDVTYAVNETDVEAVEGGATVKRLSLAIMVDNSLQDQSDSIEGIIKEAVGYDETRGDTFRVAYIEFTPLEEVEGLEEEMASYEQKEFIITLMKHGIQGLSVVGVILILFLVLKRAEKKAKAAAEAPGESALAQSLSEERSMKERKKTREEVMSAVQADPVMASEILHEWLKEEVNS